MPALILIFSAIDFVSALARPAGKPDTQRSDFIAWVERYMPCRDRLGISGTDLYAARCGVVHAMSSDSRLQREGKVKRIFYTWGNKHPEPMNAALQGEPGTFVKVETLFEVFLEGLGAFGTAVDKSEELQRLVASRTGMVFAEYPDLPPPGVR